MSTIFVFSSEVPALASPAPADILLLWDTSVGRMKRSTLTQVGTITKTLSRGANTSSTIGFYGATAIDQGAFTATALTALAAATISAGKDAGVWGFASSTAAGLFCARAAQAQVDLKNLMAKVNSTGLVKIAGV